MVSDFRKGRYNLMKIYVGIDIAKLNHFAAAISSDGEIILGNFKKGGCNIFCSGTKSRCVVCYHKVIVNGLWYTDYFHITAY